MDRLDSLPHRSLALAIASLLLAGCAGNPTTLQLGHVPVSAHAPQTARLPQHAVFGHAGLPFKPAAQLAPSQLVALPKLTTRAFIESAGGANLGGSVGFQIVSDGFFANNAANYHVQSAMPSANAIVTLATLEEDLFTRNGGVITTTADGTGNFTLAGQLPTDRPVVIGADLVASHRLSALVLPGQATINVNEASTAIAEMARWQLQTLQPVPNGPFVLQGQTALTPTVLSSLQTNSEAILTPADFASSAQGPIPSIDGLKLGAGHVLRNLYVADFGSKVTAAGSSAANALSDAWKTLLGFRPLALTRVAGNGIADYNAGNDKPATSVSLLTPMDAVSDEQGNVYLSEQDSSLLRFIPANNMPSYLGQQSAMTAGNLYNIGGQLGGITNLQDFNAFYRDSGIEPGSVVASNAIAPSDLAPNLSAGPFPLLNPNKLLVTQVGAPATHAHDIYFTTSFGHRVMFIPGQNYTVANPLFGRQFQQGHLYTLAGTGLVGTSGPPGKDALNYGAQLEAPSPGNNNSPRFTYRLGDGGLGYQATLSVPTGLTSDASGNLFILDSGHDENELDSSVTDPAQPSYVYQTGATRFAHVYHGSVRILQAGSGKIFTLHLKPAPGTPEEQAALQYGIVDVNGSPAWTIEHAKDLRLSPNGQFLYVADTASSWVFRVPLTGLTAGGLATTIDTMTQNPDPVTMQAVLGTPQVSGFINSGPPVNALYPDIYHVSAGMPPAQVLLNAPSSIDFDPAGNLIVADSGNGRIRMLKPDGGGAPMVYTLAGGLDTNFLGGDARLGLFPGTTYLNVENSNPAGRNLLVVDSKENIVRRIHTARGFLGE